MHCPHCEQPIRAGQPVLVNRYRGHVFTYHSACGEYVRQDLENRATDDSGTWTPGTAQGED